MDRIKLDNSIYVLERNIIPYKLEISNDSTGILKLYGYAHKNIIDTTNVIIENYANLSETEYIYAYDINKWINIENFEEYCNLLTIITNVPILDNCLDIIETKNITYIIKKID